MPKQHELIAIEQDKKKRLKGGTQTDVYKTIQKTDLYFGMHREYHPYVDGAEKQPSESKIVQRHLQKDIKEFLDATVELIDLMATKDTTNQIAQADILLPDGRILASGVSVASLLSLEKEFQHLRSFYEKLPTLPTDTLWIRDEGTGTYSSPEQETMRQIKTQKPIVLYEATDKHPAQTQLITQDVSVGVWKSRKLASVLTETEKALFLSRIDILLDAVKQARERANSVEVVQKNIGQSLISFLKNG